MTAFSWQNMWNEWAKMSYAAPEAVAHRVDLLGQHPMSPQALSEAQALWLEEFAQANQIWWAWWGQALAMKLPPPLPPQGKLPGQASAGSSDAETEAKPRRRAAKAAPAKRKAR